jgi:hypothetical protein
LQDHFKKQGQTLAWVCLFCFIKQLNKSNSGNSDSVTEKHNGTVLSAKEKEKMLKEVEQQQADFGISK